MRKHQPQHEKKLNLIEGLKAPEVIRRIRVEDFKADDFLDSEVLAWLIRNRVHASDGIVDEAVDVLNRRIQVLVGKRLGREWYAMKDRSSTVLEDTIDYVWDALLKDDGISNCEVYFAVFVRERADDYMRHLLAEKNSMKSVDAMTVNDKDGNETAFIDTVRDNAGETPEQVLMRIQQTFSVRGVLISLPQAERNAFYFRFICKYDWEKVATHIGCSIPTARQHYNRSLGKLMEAMK